MQAAVYTKQGMALCAWRTPRALSPVQIPPGTEFFADSGCRDRAEHLFRTNTYIMCKLCTE